MREDLWARPRSVVCVFGGAGGLHDLLVPNLRRLMKRGVVAAAIHAGGLIIDGGTAAGIMDMVGASLTGSPPKTLRLIGVCPGPLVAVPNPSPSAPPPDPTLATLESHHANFVLVPASDWGGETSTMFTFASVLSARLPCVSVLANGGMISRKEVLFAVRHNIPVIVIEGSGRLADQVRLIHVDELQLLLICSIISPSPLCVGVALSSCAKEAGDTTRGLRPGSAARRPGDTRNHDVWGPETL